MGAEDGGVAQVVDIAARRTGGAVHVFAVPRVVDVRTVVHHQAAPIVDAHLIVGYVVDIYGEAVVALPIGCEDVGQRHIAAWPS